MDRRMTRLVRFLTLMAVMSVTPVAAEPASSHQTATTMAREFLTAFNGGRRSEYEAYLRNHWPSYSATDEYADMRAQSGGYDLIEVVGATETSVVEVVKSRLADDYLRFEINVGAGQDRLIEKLAFTPSERPRDIAPPPRLSVHDLRTLVDREISAIADFSGAVLIALDGRPVYLRADGLADRDRNIPNAPRTRFNIASMGKMFTAVAILQLNQAGKLDLDATVGSVLPDYPNSEFGKHVTVRQLLTHTGGAGDFMSQLWADHFAQLNSPADYIALFGVRPPEFPPGSRFSYANYGYIVLGRIIEVASGQSYEDYLRDHIFRPTGMVGSGLNAPPIEPSDLAVRYVKTQNGYGRPPAPFLGAATPAGDAYSTVGDLFAFATSLVGHRLLDRAHTELLLSPKVKSDDGAYAFGFEVQSDEGVHEVGHDGGGPGANGTLRILDNGKAIVVVLSNVAPTWRADKLGRFITSRIKVN